MTFERTASGQSNRAIFFRTDLICYVEGDPGQESSIDVTFWSTVFSALAPHLTIHFAARGGKPVLENLARRVLEEDISDTIIAMDRDYSPFLSGSFLDDHRVFYTYGYSWENDAYCEFHIQNVVRRASRRDIIPVELALPLSQDQMRLAGDVGKVVFADFIAVLKGGSVLNRGKPGRYFEKNVEGRPILCRRRCLEDTELARQALATHTAREATGYPREGSRYLWGKAFEHYVRMGITATLRDLCERTLGHDHLRDLAIACFGQCLASGQNSPVLDYYKGRWASFQDR